MTATGTDPRRAALHRWARALAWATILYNAGEGVVAIAAGTVAGSVALISFGLDSAVEVGSALVVLWQFSRPRPEDQERRALRWIAVSFFALAAYVVIDAGRSLLSDSAPSPSTVGIVLTAASLVVMPVLTYAKRRVGRALNSATVVADSTQTLLCTYLSAVVLLGLVLNATLGWSWADPVAALAIAAVAVREGIQAWRGDACCDTTPVDAAVRAGARCGAGCCD